MQTMNAKKQRLENWDDLRFFLAVARNGGLSGAARALGVNQSTVFRRIGQLEAYFSARLFDRQARGYELTAVGEEMLIQAAKVEDDINTLDRSVLGADLEVRGTVRITTVSEVLERLAPHFKSFRNRYPGIKLEVNTEQRLLNLSHREADVAIRPGHQPTEPSVIGRKLVSLQTCAYASLSYLEGRERPNHASQLKQHDLIAFNNNHWLGELLSEHVDEARVVYRADGMMGQAIAARSGLGIAFLPTFIGQADEKLQNLFALPPIENDHLWLLIHSDLRQTARVRAFVDFITEAIIGERAIYEGDS